MGIAKLFGWNDDYDENIMGYDVSGKVEDYLDSTIHEDATDSWVTKVGGFVGKALGYKALAAVPFVGVALCAIGGAGVRTEESINTQMAETGCTNDWYILFDSLVGSAEGFGFGYMLHNGSAAQSSIKNGGFKSIGEGIKNMFSGGFKSGMTEFIKSIPKVFANTGLSSLTDPAAWAQTGGQFVDRVKTIFETGDITAGDVWWIFNPFKGMRMFDFFGQSGMGYFQNFK